MSVIILLFLWWLSGAASFVFWWTRDYPLRANDVCFACFTGLIGPFAFICGWDIHGKGRTIFKKRK